MKKADLYRIKTGLEDFGDVKGGVFAHRVVKNLQLIMFEIEVLDKIRKPSDEYTIKVQKPIEELVRKYALKNEEGNIVEEQTEWGTSIKVDSKNESKFIEDKEKILVNNPKLVEEYENQLKEFEKVLDEEIKLPFIYIESGDIPEHVSVKQLYKIRELLED